MNCNENASCKCRHCIATMQRPAGATSQGTPPQATPCTSGPQMPAQQKSTRCVASQICAMLGRLSSPGGLRLSPYWPSPRPRPRGPSRLLQVSVFPSHFVSLACPSANALYHGCSTPLCSIEPELVASMTAFALHLPVSAARQLWYRVPVLWEVIFKPASAGFFLVQSGKQL